MYTTHVIYSPKYQKLKDTDDIAPNIEGKKTRKLIVNLNIWNS